MSSSRENNVRFFLRIANFLLCFWVAAGPTDGRAQQGDPTLSALRCQAEKNLNDFSACWSREMMSNPQRQVADCVSQSGSPAEFVFCATQRRLSPSEQRLAGCAFQSGGNLSATASCAGYGYLDREQQRLVGCVASHGSNFLEAAICAGGQYLTPEQAIVANCAIQTGGQPYAFAGCVGGQVTTSELQKCLAVGIGGAGCFGSNNAIVKATSDGWKGVAGGPNSVFNNPGQLAGGPNSVINNPSQIFGGPNSAFRNPEQLAPPPVNLGTVGGKRVCIPWC
jgi:hypothetical protein